MRGTASFILALALLALPGCRESEILGDTVELDRKFIPLLVAADAGDSLVARAALAEFLPQWETFRDRYYNHADSDSLWVPDFILLDELVDSAALTIDSGYDMSYAHEDLEDFRMIMFEVRDRNDIDYFVDYLNEFHELADQIGAITRDRNSRGLTDADMDELDRLGTAALDVWEDVEELEFDARLHRFDDDRTTQLERGIRAVGSQVRRLQQAVAGDERVTATGAGNALRPELDELYRLFGDFEPL